MIFIKKERLHFLVNNLNISFELLHFFSHCHLTHSDIHLSRTRAVGVECQAWIVGVALSGGMSICSVLFLARRRKVGQLEFSAEKWRLGKRLPRKVLVDGLLGCWEKCQRKMPLARGLGGGPKRDGFHWNIANCNENTCWLPRKVALHWEIGAKTLSQWQGCEKFIFLVFYIL